MLWPSLNFLKTLFSRSLKIFISKTQRPSFWFCLRTKNLFQMIFLNSSFQFISTRVTSDLSSLKWFPKFISLKTRLTKWVTLILVWSCKTFPKDLCSLIYLKLKWNDPYSLLISKHGSFNSSWKLPLVSKYFKHSYLSFVR